MRREATMIALTFFALNLGLWVSGEIGPQEFPAIYRDLPSGYHDLNGSANFQDNLILTNDANVSIRDENVTNTNFIVTVLDFIESVPVLGPLIRLISFGLDFLTNATFGVTLFLMKIGVPIQWVVVIGALNFGIVTLGVLEYLLNVTASRGGVK